MAHNSVRPSYTSMNTICPIPCLLAVDQNKNLGEESSRYWHVILNKTFDFSRYQKIANHVMKHTKLQVLRFYDKYVALNAPCRKKLSVHVVAKQHEEMESQTTPAAISTDNVLSQATLINDPMEFRRSMPLFSMPTKIDVEVVDLGINIGNCK